MSIWTAKEGYDNSSDFVSRTKTALNNQNKRGFIRDAGPIQKNNKAMWIVDELKKLNDIDLLEVGCGYGRWSEILLPHCRSYAGVDITKDRVEYAQENYASKKCKFHHIEEDWDLEKQFDIVVCVNVIQHLIVPAAIELLINIDRHLKGGGLVLMHEAKLGWFSESEAENMYAQKDCAVHMIPKPVHLLIKSLPWDWTKEGHRHKIRKVAE